MKTKLIAFLLTSVTSALPAVAGQFNCEVDPVQNLLVGKPAEFDLFLDPSSELPIFVLWDNETPFIKFDSYKQYWFYTEDGLVASFRGYIKSERGDDGEYRVDLLLDKKVLNKDKTFYANFHLV